MQVPGAQTLGKPLQGNHGFSRPKPVTCWHWMCGVSEVLTNPMPPEKRVAQGKHDANRSGFTGFGHYATRVESVGAHGPPSASTRYRVSCITNLPKEYVVSGSAYTSTIGAK